MTRTPRRLCGRRTGWSPAPVGPHLNALPLMLLQLLLPWPLVHEGMQAPGEPWLPVAACFKTAPPPGPLLLDQAQPPVPAGCCVRTCRPVPTEHTGASAPSSQHARQHKRPSRGAAATRCGPACLRPLRWGERCAWCCSCCLCAGAAVPCSCAAIQPTKQAACCGPGGTVAPMGALARGVGFCRGIPLARACCC